VVRSGLVTTYVVEQPPAPPKTPGALTLAELDCCHEDYCPELWEKLELLREGGWRMLANADRFVPKAPDEAEKLYRWRLQVTSYVNYLAPLVGFLTGALFQSPLSMSQAENAKGAPASELPDPLFYTEFARDCDRCGTDFSQFARVTVAHALVFKRCVVGVDLPPALPAQNRAQEDELGVGRAYLYRIDLGELINWEKDEFKRFKWAVLKREVRDRSSWRSASGGYQLEFKIWERLDTGAVFSVYRSVRTFTADQPPRPEDEFTPVVEQAPTSFAEIPLYELELPSEVWFGDQAGPLCAEHFRRRSDLAGAMQRSLVEIPYIARGPEIPAVHGAFPSETQQDPNRGRDPVGQARSKGWVEVGAGDSIGFAGPSGRAFALAAKERDATRDEIYRSVNAAALALDNTDAAVRRSGESKKQDAKPLAVVLSFLAKETLEWANRVYAAIAQARGERVKWQANGLDSYDAEDTEALIAEGQAVESISIRSRTFHVRHQQKLARGFLPRISVEDRAAIEKEIEANISAEEFSEPAAPAAPFGADPLDDGPTDPDEGDDTDQPGAKPGKKKEGVRGKQDDE
jgi:hypothetical protein